MKVCRLAIAGMLLASLMVAVGPRKVAAQAVCDPPPLSKEELREPICLRRLLDGDFPDRSETPGSPILHGSIPRITFQKRPSDARRWCKSAGDRKNLQSSPETLLKAYAFVSENIMTDKAQRKRPEDADVAALLGDTPTD